MEKDSELLIQCEADYWSYVFRSTDTTQRFWNPSCFGDHNVTKGFAVSILQTSNQKIYRFFFYLLKHFTHWFIALYCKIRLAVTCGILADLVTYDQETNGSHAHFSRNL